MDCFRDCSSYRLSFTTLLAGSIDRRVVVTAAVRYNTRQNARPRAMAWKIMSHVQHHGCRDLVDVPASACHRFVMVQSVSMSVFHDAGVALR